MRIIILFEPRTDRTIPFPTGIERYRRFAEELSQFSGGPVPLTQGTLCDAPTDAYILFAPRGDLARSLGACDPVLAALLPSRLVLLDVGWQETLRELERHQLAGAIDSLRMSEWLGRPSSSKGMFGLRYLAKTLGASCSPLPWFRSSHYCRLDSTHHRGMPHLLADYLAAYERDQKPLDTLPSVALARLVQTTVEKVRDLERRVAGRKEEPKPVSLVESVSTRRVVASLKKVREQAGMTLSQVAESAGIDPERLGLLEAGDFTQTTLGMLRGYVLALEPRWGWTLTEGREVVSSSERLRADQVEAEGASDQLIVVSNVAATAPTGSSIGLGDPIAAGQVVIVKGGRTISHPRPVRRRQFAGQFDPPTEWKRKEETHAGV